MMKIAYSTGLVSSVFATSLLLTPVSTEARTFGYVGLQSGYSYEILLKSTFVDHGINYSLDSSFAQGIPVVAKVGYGHNYSPRYGVRAEGEYAYRFGGKFQSKVLGEATEVKIQAGFHTLLGNLYIDYYLSPWLSLYLGAGLGVAHFNATTEMSKNSQIQKITPPSNTTFAWQVGVGLGYVLMQNLGLDITLRYVGFGKGSFSDATYQVQANYPFSAVEALVGFQYRF